MQYNLKPLFDNQNLQNYSITTIIDDLNKQGVETESYSFVQNNIFFDFKIPADRSDLKNYYFFYKEFYRNFGLSEKNKWFFLRKLYKNILKKELNKTNNIALLNENFNSNQYLVIKWNYYFGNITLVDFSSENINNKDENSKISFIIYNLAQLYKKTEEKSFITYKKTLSVIDRSLLLRKNRLEIILGKDNFNKDIFNALPFKLIAETKEKIFVDIPPYRNDLKREIDLIEEYAKVIKYENFVLNYPNLTQIKKNKKREELKLIKDFFILHNFDEVFTNSLTNVKNQNTIALINPLSQEFENLNISLLQNHLELIDQIARNNKKEIKVFEIARLFRKKERQIEEIDMLQFSQIINNVNKNFLEAWIDAKSQCDQFFSYLNYLNIETFLPSDKSSQQSIVYKSQGKIIARLISIKEKGKKGKFVFIFQLNLNTLLKITRNIKIKKIKEISKYPAIEKDLSFFCSKSINLHKLKKDVTNLSPFIKKVSFFDLYAIKNKNKLGLRLTFQSFDFTLTNLQIETELRMIINFLVKNHNLNLEM